MVCPVIQKYARVLVDYSVRVKKGDLVIIRMGSSEAQPLVKEIYKRVLELGAFPVVRCAVDELNEIFIKMADDEQLNYIDPMTKVEYEKANKFISIGAPLNVKNMARADKEKMAKRSNATRELSSLLLNRSAKGELDWVIADYPTNALAQEAKMSLDEYKKFIESVCYLDLDNPIAKWEEIGKKQQKIAEYLNKTSKIRYVGAETDITFSTKGRKWVSCEGHFNFPDGEIFTSPIEDSAEGYIYFDYPAIYRGSEANKIRLKLEAGKVVDFSCESGEEFFKSMINIDEGAKFVGEIAIGTNERVKDITGNILFDEKIGGSIHMALGASYPETGGKNVSGLHWDLIKDMKCGGKIFADDILIYENGEFLI